jgi:hypothetical protein
MPGCGPAAPHEEAPGLATFCSHAVKAKRDLDHAPYHHPTQEQPDGDREDRHQD